MGPEEDPRERAIKDEAGAYFKEKVYAHKTNVLEWRTLSESRFQNIAKLAKAVICIPATSTPSERLFSAVGIIMSKTLPTAESIKSQSVLKVNNNVKLFDCRFQFFFKFKLFKNLSITFLHSFTF